MELPLQPPRSLTTAQRREIDLSSTIKGWGSDLDAARRPGVPRDKAPGLGVEALYPPIPRQARAVKIHKSTEHGTMPPVFGTSCPPRGLSGKLRDFAYQFSEGRLARWMTLMLADRVNVVEGLAEDLSRGHVPNIPREMGIRAEWHYNRAGFMRKVFITAVCVGAVTMLIRNRKA